jgi:hypothetical protein
MAPEGGGWYDGGLMKRQFTIRLDEGVDSQELLARLRERFTDVWAPEMIMQTEGTLSIINPKCVPTRKFERPRSRIWYWLFLREVSVDATEGKLRVQVLLSNGLWIFMLVLGALLCAALVYAGMVVGDGEMNVIVTAAIIYPILAVLLLPPAAILYSITINTVRDWIVSVVSDQEPGSDSWWAQRLGPPGHPTKEA